MLVSVSKCFLVSIFTAVISFHYPRYCKHSFCKLSICKASGTSTASAAMLVLVGKWLPCIPSLTTVTKPTQPFHINIIVAFNHRYLHCQCHPHLVWDDYYWLLCLSVVVANHHHHWPHSRLQSTIIIIGLITHSALPRIYGGAMSKCSSPFVNA